MLIISIAFWHIDKLNKKEDKEEEKDNDSEGCGFAFAKTLPDGGMVLKLDWVWCHGITTPDAILDMTVRGCDKVFDLIKSKPWSTTLILLKDTASAIQGKIVREWSQKLTALNFLMSEEMAYVAIIRERAGFIQVRLELWR